MATAPSLDLTPERVDIGDTTEFITKINLLQSKLETFAGLLNQFGLDVETDAVNSVEPIKTAAEDARDIAVAALAAFQSEYLGPLASDPVSGLVTGQFYFNTTDNEWRMYNGASWQAGPGGDTYTTAQIDTFLSGNFGYVTGAGTTVVARGGPVSRYTWRSSGVNARTFQVDSDDFSAGDVVTIRKIQEQGAFTLTVANGVVYLPDGTNDTELTVVSGRAGTIEIEKVNATDFVLKT